jgi:hypothetical protein
MPFVFGSTDNTTKSVSETNGKKAFVFSQIKPINIQTPNTYQPPKSIKPTETKPTITQKTVGLIPKSVLKGFNSDSPLVKSPLLPVISKVLPTGFGEETDRLRKRFLDSATFGITGEADTSLGKDVSYRDGRSFKDDALGASLDLAATLAGYAIPGLGWAKAAKAIGAGAKAIPKLVQGATKTQQASRIGKIAAQQAKEGIAIGAAIGASEVAVREAINPDNYSTKDNLGKISIDTLGGAILDPIAYGGFKGASKLLSKIKKQPEAEQVIQEVENLKKVPEVSTEIKNVNEGTETVKGIALKLDPTIKLPSVSKKPISKIEFIVKEGKKYNKKFLDENAEKVEIQKIPFYIFKKSENDIKLIERNSFREFINAENPKELITKANEKINMEKETIKFEKERIKTEEEIEKLFLNEEQINKIKEIKSETKRMQDYQKSLPFLNKQEKDAYIKGLGLKQSAEIRDVTQGEYLISIPGGLTTKELDKKVKSFLAIRKNDKVKVDNKQALVKSTGFGKATIEFKDGTTKQVPISLISKEADLKKIQTKQIEKINQINKKRKEMMDSLSIKPPQKITIKTKYLPTKQFKNILKKGLTKNDLVKSVKSKNKREQNKEFFQKVDDDFKTKENAPSVEELADMPIKSEVVIAKTDFKDSIEIAAKKLDTNFIDQFSPLNRLDPDIHMSKADTVRANNLTNESVYGENQVDINGNVVGRSLEKIYESSGNAEEFSKYLIYRQAISKGEEGDLVFSKEKIEGLGLTPKKMEEIVKQLEKKYPKFIKAGEEWNGYYANLRKMMLEEGNWTSDFISKLETTYPNYTPLFRDYDEKTRIAINKKSVFGGSERDVIDPYISSIELTRLFNNFMLHNRTNRELLKRVRENPETYKELGIELDTSVKMDEEEVGMNIVEELSNFEKQLQTEEINKENFITAFENGKKIKIIIKDPEIFQAFASIPQQSQGILLRGVEALTKATKMAATGTLAPIWATKGAVMDISRALLNAENPITHLGLVGKALFSSLARNAKVGKNLRKMADNFFNAGGGFSGALRTAPEARLPESKLGKKFRKINPLNERSYAQQYNDLFENINRIAAYDAKIRKLTDGKRPPTSKEITLAMKYAREITTDYTVRGKIARQLEKGFPYTTASIAGTTQILKSMKKNPIKAMSLIGIGAMLPALQEQARFGNDEDYKNLPNREKYRNLIIGKTAEGKFIKIPIDPQIAFLKEITNQILSAYKQQDKETFDGAMEELLNSYAPPPLAGVLKTFTSKEGIAGGVIGGLRATSLSPVVSVLTNKTFTGSPIESLEYQLSPLRPGLRYDEKTSGIAKKIGQYTNFSPMKVDYIIKNYSGDIGRVLLPLTSDVGSIRSEEFLKNFLTDPTFTNTLNVQFYKGKDNLKSARAEYTELKKEPPKWYNERLYQAINSQANGSVNKRLSYLNQLKRATSLDKNLTTSQRKDKIRDIQRAMNEIYLDWNTIMKKYGVPVK